MASRPPVTGARQAPCGNRPVPQETVITHRMRVGIFRAPFCKPGIDAEEMISFVNDSGFGAIGTPDMVNAQIERLWSQSNGGFGAYLMLAHNWANFDATRKSYDLIARHVFPQWQGQMSTLAAAERARAARPELAAIHSQAMEAATQRYAAEAAARAR